MVIERSGEHALKPEIILKNTIFFTVRKIPESNLTNKRERKVVLVQL